MSSSVSYPVANGSLDVQEAQDELSSSGVVEVVGTASLSDFDALASNVNIPVRVILDSEVQVLVQGNASLSKFPNTFVSNSKERFAHCSLFEDSDDFLSHG